MERLDFAEESKYNSVEVSIHLNRYLTAKQYVNGKRVLDIACGEGYGSKLMKTWGADSVVGVDISEEALKVANNQFSGDGVVFLKHTAEELPFENNSFDVVVSFETVEHLDYPEKLLQEIARVVKFNGVVLISCPNDPYYSKNDPAFSNPFHKHAFSFFDFKEMSERYLGKDASWYFGFGLSGFSTIPMKDIRLPEGGDEGLPQKMLSMFEYEYPKVTAVVRAESYLNYWNACYYLGIWGYDAARMEERGVFYPKEFFSGEDSPIWTDIERWKKEYTREQKDAEHERMLANEHSKELEQKCQEYQAILNELKRKLHVAQIDNERTSNLLKIAEEEKARLWGRIGHTQWELDNTRAEYDQIRSEYDDFQSVKTSKCYKLIQLWWRFRNRLKRLFGRK